MANSPAYVPAIVESLASAGLFRFSDEARKEIDSFFAATGVASDGLLEQGRALSHLHAAEYALEPAFSEPGSLRLPPSEPVGVTVREARLALLKGDCSLIIWTHAPAQERITTLPLWDLTVFSGDMSKLTQVSEDAWTGDASDVGRLQGYVGRLQAIYEESRWEPASRVAASGAVWLQGLLWRLKTAVVYDASERAIARALEEFGIATA
jgi:hypothetical protein